MNNTTNTETSSPSTVHPFTAAGLGQAPFRYIGAEVQDLCYGQAVIAGRDGIGPMVTTKPGGTCAYCGNYILNMFNVKSADGKVFHVGSDCIEKVYGPTHKIVRAVAKVVADRTKARKAARDAAKIEEAVQLLARNDVRAKLAETAHPNAFRANTYGDTLLNWAEFLIAHGGTAGKLRAAHQISKAFEALDIV